MGRGFKTRFDVNGNRVLQARLFIYHAPYVTIDCLSKSKVSLENTNKGEGKVWPGWSSEGGQGGLGRVGRVF